MPDELLVVYLTETLGYLAGGGRFALTVANLGGIVGRIVWGAVADRYVRAAQAARADRRRRRRHALRDGRRSAPSWPSRRCCRVCVLFGTTAIGWNGVQLSEVARHAPWGQEGSITGAAGFVTLAEW